MGARSPESPSLCRPKALLIACDTAEIRAVQPSIPHDLAASLFGSGLGRTTQTGAAITPTDQHPPCRRGRAPKTPVRRVFVSTYLDRASLRRNQFRRRSTYAAVLCGPSFHCTQSPSGFAFKTEEQNVEFQFSVEHRAWSSERAVSPTLMCTLRAHMAAYGDPYQSVNGRQPERDSCPISRAPPLKYDARSLRHPQPQPCMRQS
ncbi:hypothetical protein SKAU_G00211250 [Synaphobranchus kaupii]|uniref:Uncharacterized protein n=1 Tax=Synaphobranchus kaupii TaxID=118154 RepID=A0A9Q1F8Y9_SYNKA|nr:hypothetical protein SKAU_G00211250 [Synaphobranchus kaupii]